MGIGASGSGLWDLGPILAIRGICNTLHILDSEWSPRPVPSTSRRALRHSFIALRSPHSSNFPRLNRFRSSDF
jgi:hypothetical protein